MGVRRIARRGEAAAGKGKPGADLDSWITVEVEHLASPQGSHFSPAKGVVRESNQRTELYRQAVADACEALLGEDWEPLDGPLECLVLFRMMPAPKSDKDRPWPHYPPDLDKLLRATFDGVTRGRLWKDDGRVVRVSAQKEHAGTPEETGVTIMVRRLP